MRIKNVDVGTVYTRVEMIDRSAFYTAVRKVDMALFYTSIKDTDIRAVYIFFYMWPLVMGDHVLFSFSTLLGLFVFLI